MSIFNNDESFSSYCREASEAYWAEEAEYEAGVHPTQVKERIDKEMKNLGFDSNDISFLDWDIEGPKVKVSTNGSYFGIFNYETNKFEMLSMRVMQRNSWIQRNAVYGVMGGNKNG